MALKHSASGEMNALCSQYTGFHRFAKLLERIAGGIQDGRIDVPK